MLPKQGLKSISKLPEEEYVPKKEPNVVRLRFTRRQYETFKDACNIVEQLVADPAIKSTVKKLLNGATVDTNFTKPIIQAPTRIAGKPKKVDTQATSVGSKERETYFVKSRDVNRKVGSLWEFVKDEIPHDHLRFDQEGETCISDVRIMISAYIKSQKLKQSNGVVVDDFLQMLAPDVLKDKKIIPKEDKRTIMMVVNEVFAEED
jgi:hypothetical protein